MRNPYGTQSPDKFLNITKIAQQIGSRTSNHNVLISLKYLRDKMSDLSEFSCFIQIVKCKK